MFSGVPVSGLDSIRVTESGSIDVEGDRAKLRLSVRTGDFDLILDTDHLLLLRRAYDNAGVRVPLCGEITGPASVTEMLNVALMMQFKGEIWVQDSGEQVTRVLGIENGVLCNTRSTDPDDRLGGMLVRSGMATTSQVEGALAMVGPEMRLGEALIASGAVDADTLYAALQHQAQEVMYKCMWVRSGVILFVTMEASSQVAPHTVHLPLQSLLLEGVQRIDELSLFRQAIPSDDLFVFATDVAVPVKLSVELQMILATCDGKSTIEDIAQTVGVTTFQVVKSVYSLMQSGLVTVGAGDDRSEEMVFEMLADCNSLLGYISDTIMRHGKRTTPAALRTALQRWSARGDFEVWQLPSAGGQDLTFDVEALGNAILDSDEPSPIARTQRMISDMAAFALFLASTLLPREHEKALSRYVAHELRAMRGRLEAAFPGRPTPLPPGA